MKLVVSTCSLAVTVLAFATKCDEESGGDSDLDAGVVVATECGGLAPEVVVGVGGRRDDQRSGVEVADGGVTFRTPMDGQPPGSPPPPPVMPSIPCR